MFVIPTYYPTIFSKKQKRGETKLDHLIAKVALSYKHLPLPYAKRYRHSGSSRLFVQYPAKANGSSSKVSEALQLSDSKGYFGYIQTDMLKVNLVWIPRSSSTLGQHLRTTFLHLLYSEK